MLICCLTEIVVVMHVYGVRRFVSDVRLMLGNPPSKFYRVMGYPVNAFWIVCWYVLTSVLMAGVLIFNLAIFGRSTYDSMYTFPHWADGMGWCITVSCILPLPVFAFYKVYQAKTGYTTENPSETHERLGPRDPEARILYLASQHQKSI